MAAHPRRRLVALIASIAVVLGIGITGYRLTRSDGTYQPNNGVTATAPHRICPVVDCSAYPVPSQVQGITISALQSWLIDTHLIYRQISDMRRWHANTVRLQVLQDKLVGVRGQRFAPGYMRTLARAVRYALHKHMFVVIADQTELSLGWPENESLPTQATDAFWWHMTKRWGHNPRVVFDLFNEPRKCSWQQWYLAMEPLVTRVRADGSLNQLWVEGRWWGSTLEGVPLLPGQGLVYTFHHPGSPWPYQSPVTPANWHAAFGYLADAGIPVVDGEFTNYVGGYYWPHSTRMVTLYLRWLRAHGVGLVAWSLAAGVMSSTDYTHALAEPHADGRLIQRYFWHQL